MRAPAACPLGGGAEACPAGELPRKLSLVAAAWRNDWGVPALEQRAFSVRVSQFSERKMGALTGGAVPDQREGVLRAEVHQGVQCVRRVHEGRLER